MQHIIGITIDGINYSAMVSKNDEFYLAGGSLYATVGIWSDTEDGEPKGASLIIFDMDTMDAVYGEKLDDYVTGDVDPKMERLNDILVQERILRYVASRNADNKNGGNANADDDDSGEDKDYYVTFAANVRYVAAVRASSLEEAKKFAQNDFEAACFGKLEFVDSDLIMVEDEDGNYLYEK